MVVSLFLGTLSGRAKVTMQGPDFSAAFVLVFVSLDMSSHCLGGSMFFTGRLGFKL